ncbi:MAG: hypothetical protein LJE84_04625 [Gammaproteobacteria bacterium]|nr:hypothetical protein [Gammaproteobacteria bacterium]
MKLARVICRSLLAGGLFAVVAAPVFAQEYGEIHRLGNPATAVCPGGLSSASELQAFVAGNRTVFEQIFSDAGWAGSVDDFFAAIAAGGMATASYTPGQRFEWMGQTKDKQGIARRYRVWAGRDSMRALEISVESGGASHRFAIPLVCCNVSLISSTPLPAPAPAPVVQAEPEPVPPPVRNSFIAPFFVKEWIDRKIDGVLVREHTRGVGLQAGHLIPISEHGSLLMRAGFAVTEQSDLNAVFADLGYEGGRGGNGFYGVGIGVWHDDLDTFTTVYLNGGAHISDRMRWFLEARFLVDELDDLEGNRILSTGIQMMF